MLRAKTPAGEYVYTHAVIRKETGVTSRSLNRLIAVHLWNMDWWAGKRVQYRIFELITRFMEVYF